MPELWLTAIPDDGIRTLQAIRASLRFFDPKATLECADRVLTDFKERGYAFVAEGSTEQLCSSSDCLSSYACETRWNLDPEQYESRLRARKMTASGATPEEVFAAEAPAEPQPEPSTAASDTALVLMAASEGNPIRAAITAANLARTTGDAQTHHGAVTALVSAFPWLAKALATNGVEL